MRRVATTSLMLLLVSMIAACVNETEMRKRDIQHFLQSAMGEYNNEAGERLFMVPVHARMIGLDTMYLERTTRNGTTGRLLALERFFRVWFGQRNAETVPSIASLRPGPI